MVQMVLDRGRSSIHSVDHASHKLVNVMQISLTINGCLSLVALLVLVQFSLVV